MKRIYNHYKNWECYKNGMFKTQEQIREVDWYRLENLAIDLLTNSNDFYNAGIKLLNEWKVSCDENLTNTNQNRIAYVGQACCCLIHGIPEIVTKSAWKQIPQDKQQQANSVAEKIIKVYERENRKVHSGLGEEMLF